MAEQNFIIHSVSGGRVSFGVEINRTEHLGLCSRAYSSGIVQFRIPSCR